MYKKGEHRKFDVFDDICALNYNYTGTSPMEPKTSVYRLAQHFGKKNFCWHFVLNVIWQCIFYKLNMLNLRKLFTKLKYEF